jgi:predicted dehydrogenase
MLEVDSSAKIERGDMIGVVLVGCGYIAQAEHIPGWQLEPLGRLVGVVDLDEPVAAQVGEACGVPHFAALADALASLPVDAVHICTPAGSHAALVSEALRARVHVLVEKPMTTDAQTARALVHLAHAEGRTLMVGMPRLYDPFVEFVSGVLERGELGRVLAIASSWRMSHPPTYRHLGEGPRHPAVTAPPGSRVWLRERLLDEAIHHIGVLRRWMGELQPWATLLTTGAFHLALKAPGDVLITHTNVTPAGHGETFSVFGERGRIEAMTWSPHFPNAGAKLFIERSGTGEVVYPAINRINPYWAQIHEFAEVVLGRTAPRRPPEGAIEDLALVEAILDRLDDDTASSVHLGSSAASAP